MVCMWRSEDNLQESLLSAVWVLAITQVIGLGGTHGTHWVISPDQKYGFFHSGFSAHQSNNINNKTISM